MTTKERDMLIELLKRFSQEYCCEDYLEDWDYCKDCEFNDRCCCQMITTISQWLNDELTETEMMRSLNREYRLKKDD